MAATYSGQINRLILTQASYRQGEAIYGAVDYSATKSGFSFDWIPGTQFAWHSTVKAYDAAGILLDEDSTSHYSSPLQQVDSVQHTTRDLYLGIMGTSDKSISVVVTAGG